MNWGALVNSFGVPMGFGGRVEAPWVALVVSLGLLLGELGCLGWPWLSFLDPYGAHWVTRCGPGAPRAHQGWPWLSFLMPWVALVVLFGSIWRPLGHKVSSRSPPGSSRSSRNHFKLSWGGQCVQTIGFYSKICVFVTHIRCTFCTFYTFCTFLWSRESC